MADDEVTVARAASLWTVSQQSVFEWHKQGTIKIFRHVDGQLRAAVSDVRSAKVLRQKHLFNVTKAPKEVVGEAERRGLVRSSPDGRFSLDDADIIRRLHAGEVLPADGRQPQGAGEQPHQDDRPLHLVQDDGEAQDEGQNLVQANPVNPRQAELDAVIEDARRGGPVPYWYYYSNEALARGDAVYPPTTPIREWWRTPREVQAEVSDGHALREWFAGRVAYLDDKVIRLYLCGPAHIHVEEHRWCWRPVTREEWKRCARFEPEEGQYVFYAVYQDAADPRNGLSRILAQPERTEGVSAVPSD
jgi:hypothetical protein